MSPELIIAISMTVGIGVIVAVVAWIARSALNRKRKQTRRAWETFADDNDFQITDSEDSPNFELHGHYDGEPITFRIDLARSGNMSRARTTFVETTIPEAPSELVVYVDVPGYARRWKNTGQLIDLDHPPFLDTLAARSPDPTSAREFLQQPQVREALQHLAEQASRLTLQDGRLRLRRSDFVDDPQQLHHDADLLATTRRTIRNATNHPA